MRLLATHAIRHLSGDKYIRLYHGDLTAIPPEDAVDLLVISAFPNDYLQTQGSLIGALARNAGISVYELALDKEADLRPVFSSWLSKGLSQRFPLAGFQRILCFETVGNKSPTETVGLVFRAMMPFLFGEPPLRTVAMPMLAAGDQGYDAGLMLRAIFDAAAHWLARGLPIETIKLVVHSERQVEQLSGLFTTLSTDSPRPLENVGGVVGKLDYDFFLSYAHADAESADALRTGIQAANSALRVFQDKLELHSGESWQTELDHALESCRRVIALFSPDYLQSKMCIEEFNMARVRHRESGQNVLMPLYLRTAEELPLYMRTLQYIDCRECNRELVLNAARKLAFM